MPKLPLTDEGFYLLFQLETFFCIVPVVAVIPTIFIMVTPDSRPLYRLGMLEDILVLNLVQDVPQVHR